MKLADVSALARVPNGNTVRGCLPPAQLASYALADGALLAHRERRKYQNLLLKCRTLDPHRTCWQFCYARPGWRKIVYDAKCPAGGRIYLSREGVVEGGGDTAFRLEQSLREQMRELITRLNYN